MVQTRMAILYFIDQHLAKLFASTMFFLPIPLQLTCITSRVRSNNFPITKTDSSLALRMNSGEVILSRWRRICICYFARCGNESPSFSAALLAVIELELVRVASDFDAVAVGVEKADRAIARHHQGFRSADDRYLPAL